MAAVLADVELYTSGDIHQWQAALLCYDEVVALKAAGRSKKTAKSTSKEEETLVELDEWYQTDLPEVISSRDPPHLTHEELARVMKWKLTRGKFRPRLTEMVKQNSREEVEEVTKKAFALLPNLGEAMVQLTKLKAVGPATASAIMCVVAPEVAPFMADESVLAVPDLGKLDYTQKHYTAYAVKIQTKAKELTKLDGFRKWSAHDVELALWSFHFARKLQPDLLKIKTENSSESTDSEPAGDSDHELSQPGAATSHGGSKGRKRDKKSREQSDDSTDKEREELDLESSSRSKKKIKC